MNRSLMAVYTTTPTRTSCQELIIFRIQGVEFREFLCPFVMFYDSVDRYDSVTNVRWDRLELQEYWQDSITIYKNILGNTARK